MRSNVPINKGPAFPLPPTCLSLPVALAVVGTKPGLYACLHIMLDCRDIYIDVVFQCSLFISELLLFFGKWLLIKLNTPPYPDSSNVNMAKRNVG
jgi:hypothetical protein